MNVFTEKKVAETYDAYYQTDFGKQVDTIEKQLVSELLDHVPATTLLDVGCGTGHWTAFFARKGFRVTGVDTSEAMLAIAKGKGIDANFMLADSEALPFEAESQETVASIAMLEFVDNPDNVAREIYRILKPGGWFLLGSLNARSTLGQNKDKDEVFRHANMLTAKQIQATFHPFKLIAQKCGLYLSPDFTILDGAQDENSVEPVFIATLFQKE